MSEVRIDGLKNQGLLQGIKNGNNVSKAGFDEIMHDVIEKLSQIEAETENAVKEFASGGDISTAIIAMEKAEMSFQVMVEVRNRLLNAYEEVMRMQV